ncbi:hypothetical protein QBC32DRAFT_385789 [Pseudoneurospora amorphoporcata]|uniref:Leucine rich repeat domain containing protein n=1 Tax=Pseudoneurospora amorphoporcata TaxID=241081 RepID=A0AAN6NK94_9PEZI|nr:hypothetical protein QBC32DRAFT_385789 [Pseudoneurospora amorphoporcata]
MAEATLPSYQEATRKLDWLELADPYIPIDCYARLCCASWRFYKYFLPKLWADPFAICYALGPISKPDGEEIPRSELFLSTVPYARNCARSLVFAFTPRIRDWLFMLRRRPQLSPLSLWFPNLRCVTLLDCPPPDDHEHIIQLGACWFPRRPYIVAAARCSQLPVQWPDYEQFRNLIVYFDDSHIHRHQHGRPHPSILLYMRMPSLRILRATGYDLGDTDAAIILYHLGRTLWSLDLSTNRLTDRFLKEFIRSDRCRGRRQLGSRHEDGSCICFYPGHRYELEGSLCSSGMGLFIHETPWTEDLRLYHPQRYHEDSPEYAENADAEAREVRKRALDDSLEAVIKAIGLQELHSFDYVQPPFLGITHLYLNQNPILTADGFKLLIEFGFEQLQRFECDSMRFMTKKDMSRYNEYYHGSRAVPSSVSRSKTQAISGILGLSHLFRPVFANLQILRIHHSLVTNLPSLVGFDDLSAMEKIWFAETFLLPRADLVFPNPFHPDMNPRLSSLTLTHIPRYSTGPLIERLKGLLKAAWFQEQTIAKLRAEYRRVQSRYQPTLLPGLRKIFLEFDPDPRDKQGKGQTGTDAYEGFDAEALLNSGATEEFGTFGGFTSRNTRNGTSGPSTSSAVRHANANDNSATGSRRQQPQDSSELPRLAAETPWVRAVLQSRHQQWSQDVERRADGRLDWNRPVFVASTSPGSGKTKVFVGYNQDDPNHPVLNNSRVSSSSWLASSSSVQGLFDLLQFLYHPQEHVQESRMPSSLPLSTESTPGYSTRRTNSLPPAYTASPTPAPSTSTSTLLPLTPIPPCYTSFPYFLSPEEKQASLTTYDLLISRVLCLHPNGIFKEFSGPGYRPDLPAAYPAGFTAGLNPFSLNILNVLVAYYNSCGNHDAFERDHPELLRLFHPIMAATPSMARAGVPAQLLKQRLGLERDERGEREQERWLFEQFSYLRNLGRIRGNEQLNRLERVGQQIMELRERQARRREEALGIGPEKAELGPGAGAETGTGAGCHVFWNAWKAGLFGDVIFPSVSASASTPSVSASHNEQHSGSSSGLDSAAPSTSTSTPVPSNATERRSAASSRRNRNLLRKDMRRPTKEELSQMKDVIEELKKFRGLTGGGGWSGSSSKTEGSESKSKGKGKGKGKGKQKAVDGSEDEEDDQDSESEWAGKHWMGELKVIRKTTTD